MNASEPTLSNDQLRRRVQQHIQSQQWEAAEVDLRQLIKLEPHEPHARLTLANLILQRGGLRESMKQLLDAIPALSDDAHLLIQMVRRLFLGGDIIASRRCLDHLENLSNPPATQLAEQAQLRWMLGEISAAMTWMDRAALVGLEGPNQHYLHAMLLQFTGRIDQAETVLIACIHRWPRFGDAAVALANLRRQTPQSNHIDALRALSRGISLDSQSPDKRLARAGFESALFKELDDLGNYDEAWQALSRSNALMHSISPYDAVGEKAITDALIRICENIDIDRRKSASLVGPMPIFIVGMPRSGTTLLDRMLSSHSLVTSAGEINDFRRQLRWMTDMPPGGIPNMLEVFRRSVDIDFAELGARYLEQTQWRSQGKRFYIDKLPINVRMVPFIRRALPQAPILHLVRDPMDVCYSNFKIMFGNASSYCYDMRALAHYYGQYARLVEHWHHVMPGAMLDVSYSALVTEPENTMRRLLEHCGLGFEQSCVRPECNESPVATPSSAQIRESIHQRGLGQWQRYAQQLEPLRMALAEQSLV